MKWTLEIIEPLLRKVRDNLRSGVIDPSHFDMGIVWEVSRCGSVGCIGGWLKFYRHLECGDVELDNFDLGVITRDIGGPRCDGLYSLFYDRIDDFVTPAQAADAIDRWLAGNDNPWQMSYRQMSHRR